MNKPMIRIMPNDSFTVNGMNHSVERNNIQRRNSSVGSDTVMGWSNTVVHHQPITLYHTFEHVQGMISEYVIMTASSDQSPNRVIPHSMSTTTNTCH
jgi:hypothetical protein